MRWWYQTKSFSKREPQAKPAAWRWMHMGMQSTGQAVCLKKSYSKLVCVSNSLILTGKTYKLLRRHSSVLLRGMCGH